MDTIEAAREIVDTALLLMERKNADYGDSWREMRLTSITDQIIVKIRRVRQIEEAGGVSQVSEGIESEYRDILNYAVLGLIKMREDHTARMRED